MFVAVIIGEATTLVLPFLVVITVGDTGIPNASNLVVNVVNIVICDYFKVSSLSKKGIVDNVATALVTVNHAT